MTPAEPSVTQQFKTLKTDLARDAAAFAWAIADFQPDLIIGLAHSGWLPVLAAQVWCDVQGYGPLPPAIQINIGLEKIAIYDDLWDEADMDLIPMDKASPVYVGHIWHWVAQQQAWAVQLQERVKAVLPQKPPERIMVIDEIIHEGISYALVTGLLSTVYPAAELRFAAGHLLHWGRIATRYWLAHNAPALLPVLDARTNILNDADGQAMAWQSYVRNVASGTEDDNPAGLGWRPVNAESQTIRELSQFLPAEEWLKVSDWAHHTLLDHVRQQASAGIQPDTARLEIRHGFPWKPQVMGTLWRRGSLNRAELIALAPVATVVAANWVNRLIHNEEIVPLGWGRWTRYQPSPAFRPGLAEQDDPANNGYSVIPNRVWAGPTAFGTLYHHAGMRWLRDYKIGALVDTLGQTAVIQRELAAFNETHALSLQIHTLPCQKGRVPAAAALAAAVTWMTRMLEEGQRIYIQSGVGNGRAALVAAALLVHRGLTPRAAWQQLQASWAQTTWGPWLRLPATEHQHHFLLKLDRLLAHRDRQ